MTLFGHGLRVIFFVCVHMCACVCMCRSEVGDGFVTKLILKWDFPPPVQGLQAHIDVPVLFLSLKQGCLGFKLIS